MLEKLMNNPYAWLFLSVLSIFSVIFAIWTWCAGKQRKEISIHCKSNEIIKAGKQRIQKLNVMFDGRAIEDLTSTKFYIWNSGNQVLHNADIVQSKPLRIHTEKATILDAQILRVSDDTNVFEIASASDKEITLVFDYVEKGKGVLVQVLHTGNPLDLTFDCKIKGGLDVRDCTVTNKKRHISTRDRIMMFISDIIPGMGVLLSFFWLPLLASIPAQYYSDEPVTSSSLVVGFVIYIISIFVGITFSVHLGTILKRTFNLSIPITLTTEKE